MGKIYYIMGKSASGKDTIYRRLMEDKTFAFHTLVPYTTRPMRSTEVNGRDYFFTDEAGLSRLQEAGRVIELRSYQTVHGIWNYFTVDDGQVDLANDSYLLVGTLESYRKVQAYYGLEQVIPIYVEVEDGLNGNGRRGSRSMQSCADGSWRMKRIFPKKSFPAREL